MNLINYTKNFSHEYDFMKRKAHYQIEPKIKDLKFKQSKSLHKAQLNELRGPLHNLRARYNYRKADKLQDKIDLHQAYLDKIDSFEHYDK